MKKFKLRIMLFLFKTVIYSQSDKNADSILIDFDKQIEIASMPFNNGIIHKNLDKTINSSNHRYFESSNFEKGNLVYKGQLYLNINQKYDLFHNKLIIEIESVPIELNSNEISNFKVKNYEFENFIFDESKKIKNGFYHLIKVISPYNLYVSYSKFRKKIVNDDSISFEYFLEEKYIIKKNNNYYNFNNQTDINLLFPEKKAIIKEYFNDNSKLLKSNKTIFLTNLIQKLS